MITPDESDVTSRRSARLSLLLAKSDAAPRAMAFPEAQIARAAARRQVMRWRIAAGLALLIAGAAGVPPVRAWIVGTVQAAWSKVTGTAPAPVAEPAPTPPAVTMGAVSFDAPEQLVIRVLTRQDSGTLVIEGIEGGQVRAAMNGERNAAELVVGPEGLRVMNRRAAVAGYVIGVPERVARILVRVGEERTRVYDTPSPGRRFVVDLAVRTSAARTLK